MLLVVVLITMVSTLVYDFLNKGFENYRVGEESVTEAENTARAMREFEGTTRAATKIVSASPSGLAFYRFFDSGSISPRLVRYFVENNQFKVGYTDPVGVLPDITYPVSNEQIQFLVEDVINPGSLFSYYDENNNLLADLTDLNTIKMIGLSISLDKNQNIAPEPVTESTKVNLRNLKTNL